MKESHILISALIVIAIILFILICVDNSKTVVVIDNVETMDEPTAGKYPVCPSGYILSGSNCVPDGTSYVAQCDPSDEVLSDGQCRKEITAQCPAGYLLKPTSCVDAITKEKKPLTEATCPAGYTQNGPLCSLIYDGKCPTNFKNVKMGSSPCRHEFETISPQCEDGFSMKDGKCFVVKSASAEAFTRANIVEQRALESLYA